MHVQQQVSICKREYSAIYEKAYEHKKNTSNYHSISITEDYNYYLLSLDCKTFIQYFSAFQANDHVGKIELKGTNTVD